jgi:hypothetical protein
VKRCEKNRVMMNCFRNFRSVCTRQAMLVLLLATCGCASYHIGNQSLYPNDIRTVYVPMVESNSFRRDFGERLTEAIVKQVELKTPYKVVNKSMADSVLAVKLVTEAKGVTIPSLTGDARATQASIHVQVSWIDHKGMALRDTKNIPMPEELVDVTGTGNLVPEVGQTTATSQQDAINSVAKQIVGLMEAPW